MQVKQRDDINKAWDIIAARVDAGIASPGDRACYYVLGTSAFRLVFDGRWNTRETEVIEGVQAMLADSILVSEQIGQTCPDCGVTYKLVTECENEACPSKIEDK